MVTALPITVALAVDTTAEEVGAGVVGTGVGVLVAAGGLPVVVGLEFPQAASRATRNSKTREYRVERLKVM
jgi:3-hydroxyacyl-CoA dehydrogenase